MSFITEVICKCIFTDVHMRNNYRPNRALNRESESAQCVTGQITASSSCHSFFSSIISKGMSHRKPITECAVAYDFTKIVTQLKFEFYHRFQEFL